MAAIETSAKGEPSTTPKPVSKGKKSPEEAVAGFNYLRSEQRQIASKIFELDSDLSEHRIVMETLKHTEESRKCFRMVGGILVESTVKDVLPNLSNNADQLKQAIDNLNVKLIEKGKEILEFKEQNNITFQVPERIAEDDESNDGIQTNSKTTTSGVLLADKT